MDEVSSVLAFVKCKLDTLVVTPGRWGEDVVLPLPPCWAKTREASPPAHVFVDGIRVPFKRPRTPGWETRDLTYYTDRTGGLSLVVRLHQALQGRLLAVPGGRRLTVAVGALRLVRERGHLVRAAAWAAGGALLIIVSAPWRRSDSLPPLLMALTLAGWTVLGGLAGSWWSPVSHAGSLLVLSLPLVERLGSRARKLRAALPTRLETVIGPIALAALAAALARLASGLFSAYQTGAGTDHATHLALVESIARGGRLLPHPMYHLVVALSAGFAPDRTRIASAAAGTLTSLVLVNLALSIALAADLARRAGHRLSYPAMLLLGVVLFSPASLPATWRPDDLYLGQLSSVAWHNPTVTAVVPVSVVAFWLLLRVRGGRSATAVALSVALVVATATKPNIALVFLPALGLLALFRRLPPAAALVSALPTLLLLGWQYIHWGGESPAGIVALRPLAVWRLYSPHPIASTLLSLAFPVSVTAFAWRDMRHRHAVGWAWLLVTIAVLEMALLAEPGPRLADFNYYWGIVPALHLLFLTTSCELLAPRPLSGTRRGLAWCCWVLLLLHTASGIYGYCHPYQLPGWSCVAQAQVG